MRKNLLQTKRKCVFNLIELKVNEKFFTKNNQLIKQFKLKNLILQNFVQCFFILPNLNQNKSVQKLQSVKLVSVKFNVLL